MWDSIARGDIRARLAGSDALHGTVQVSFRPRKHPAPENASTPMPLKKQHQAPWECIYAKEDKSACRPGDKPVSDQEYFEVLCLCILQAGLGWGTIRANWQRYREGFHRFSINRLSKARVDKLLGKPNVLKNRSKVEAIIHNAQEFRRIKNEHGSFGDFLGSLADRPDKEVLKLLLKRFRHIGDYTAEYYLHSVGYWE